MSPIDYLRAMVGRQRKLATGGTIHADQAPILTAGCTGDGYLVPETPRPLGNPFSFPGPTIEINDSEPITVTRLVVEAPRIDLCPCIAIYTRCYCKPNTSAILDA